jgi:hypothetical protein
MTDVITPHTAEEVPGTEAPDRAAWLEWLSNNPDGTKEDFALHNAEKELHKLLEIPPNERTEFDMIAINELNKTISEITAAHKKEHHSAPSRN